MSLGPSRVVSQTEEPCYGCYYVECFAGVNTAHRALISEC